MPALTAGATASGSTVVAAPHVSVHRHHCCRPRGSPLPLLLHLHRPTAICASTAYSTICTACTSSCGCDGGQWCRCRGAALFVSVLVSRCRCFILSVWLSLTLCSDRSSTALDVTTATVAPVSVELVCVLGCGFDGGQWCRCCGAALFVSVLVSRCRCFILSVWLSLTLCSDRWSTVYSTSTSGSAPPFMLVCLQPWLTLTHAPTCTHTHTRVADCLLGGVG